MKIKKSTISKLQEIASKQEKFKQWLPVRPTEAFLVCVGSGPWGFSRRFAVQKKALELMGKDDLRSEILLQDDLFPLKWQNMIVSEMGRYLREKNWRFDIAVYSIIPMNGIEPTEMQIKFLFLGLADYKVVQMFIRDYLQADAFPIDRHVKKFLKDNGLPVNTYEMIKLCNNNGINPNVLNRAICKAENPDWRNTGGIK